MWVLSSIDLPYDNLIRSSDCCFFYTDEVFFHDAETKLTILTEGHVFKRNGLPVDDSGARLIARLYLKYGKSFISNVKGNFIIIILDGCDFYIFSDRFAIRKFFVWQNGRDFIISNRILEISKNTRVNFSARNMAIYSLTYHFTAGITIFDNVRHNIPSEVIEYKERSIVSSYYWYPSRLLEMPGKKVDVADISLKLKDIIDTALSITGKTGISLSLTGGADTRNLLALFLSMRMKPHLYTYGNPLSEDCQRASIIARGIGLDHQIYDFQMNPDTFESHARKIIRLCGALSSIHRVHRLMSVEIEKNHADWMFLGTLGGEFIKGVSEDDYIDPAIVYENWAEERLSRQVLERYLHNKYIKPGGIDIDSLLSAIVNEPYLQGALVDRKINTLSYITAHLHDAQDINLYISVMNDIFTPFLDIDYLELIFSTEFTFEKKENIRNKYIRRINNPVYSSNFLQATYPKLLSYLYSGGHKPSDVLFNKYYAGLARIIRRATRQKYPQNFPLGNWMQEFVEKQLPLCYDYPVIKETFDIKNLISEFKKGNHSPRESYWLKFTNPIMMRLSIEELK